MSNSSNRNSAAVYRTGELVSDIVHLIAVGAYKTVRDRGM